MDTADRSTETFISTMRQPHAKLLIACGQRPGLVADDLEAEAVLVTAGFIAGVFIAGDELQVENLTVRPECRGQTIGETLLRKLLGLYGLLPPYEMEEARSKSSSAAVASSCFLEVKEGNVAAASLYEKVGFKVVGKRKNFFPDGSSALLMELRRLDFNN